MIRLLRRATPTAAPARRPVPVRTVPAAAAKYTCETCQVRGHGTHCWCCGTAIGERT